MKKRLAFWGAVVALAPGMAVPTVCAAETLYDAIALAYQSNPSLRAQRAEQRATDEGLVEAKAGYGPQVSLNTQMSYQNAWVQGATASDRYRPQGITDYRAGTGTADLQAVQPIYTFGATRAQVKGAAANVAAGRETLRKTEAQLLQNVVTAYMDVRRDRAIITILKDEIVALTGEFKEIQAKGALGALGKTDVAQSEERLLSAEAQLNLSMGRLNLSSAEYLAVVGQNPGELAPEPDLPGLPRTVDEAFDAAARNNPDLREAVQTEKASREKVNIAKAANGPTISVRLDAAVQPNEPYLQRQYDQNVSATVVIAQPIFNSGLNSAKIRAALDEDNRAQLEIEAARRGAVQAVSQAWNQLVYTRSAISIEERQEVVETVAVKGNRVEERVGLRSTIELLNAELELANTRLSLVQSRHDEYVARAALLAAMGLLEARYLTPTVEIYSPGAALKQSESKLASLPLNGPVAALDGFAAPTTPEPRPSAQGAGGERPTEKPALPPEAPPPLPSTNP